MLEAGFIYFTGGRLYLWRKEEKAPEARGTPVAAPAAMPSRLGLSQNRLHDLAWSLDIRNPESPAE